MVPSEVVEENGANSVKAMKNESLRCDSLQTQLMPNSLKTKETVQSKSRRISGIFSAIPAKSRRAA